MELTGFSFLLYFFPVMLLVHCALRFSTRAQNVWLVICSAAYFLLNQYFSLLFLLAGLIVANYMLGFWVQRQQDAGKKGKIGVILACILNLLPLFLDRILEPAINVVAGLLDLQIPVFPRMPLGGAFLALQGISYIVDIYRAKARWDKSIINSALYFAFFPPLHAGPILRYHSVALQLKQRKICLDDVAKGLSRFIVGLAKLVLLARPTLSITEIIFGQSGLSGIYTTVPVSLALLGLLACVLSIYYYFSGFSDLVIGLGKMLGFAYPENFDHPQLAPSVNSFWKRCYTSLLAWFDEYVYQSLSSKRTNNDRMVTHTLIMWLLIAVWLGFGLPKIILAIWSVLFIVVERIIRVDETKFSILHHFSVLIYMLIAAIAFQTDSMYQFTLFISNLFGMRNNGFVSSLAGTLIKENWLVLAVGIVCSFPIGTKLRQYAQRHRNLLSGIISLAYPVAMVLLLALTVLSVSASSYDPYQIIYAHLWR
ncbi:hypothetical protein LJC74_04435 [Eubacteriales bacterium OttesenSCG-928-A19]|nr:hypothetical protein [Eubacteriales bacterium OttesenSCG-928-A19]